jgi:hypothetical protein
MEGMSSRTAVKKAVFVAYYLSSLLSRPNVLAHAFGSYRISRKGYCVWSFEGVSRESVLILELKLWL